MREIPSAPGYAVDENSNVIRMRDGMRPKQGPAGLDGYVGVSLRINGKQRRCYVHRLVCEAFHGPCPPGNECCHGDGNRKNNVPSNLRWGTHVDQLMDMRRHGTIRTRKQYSQFNLKLSSDERRLIEGYADREGLSLKQAVMKMAYLATGTAPKPAEESAPKVRRKGPPRTVVCAGVSAV